MPRTRGERRAAELNATARHPELDGLMRRWRDSHEHPYPDADYAAIAKHADSMLRRGDAPEIVTEALRLWDARPNAAPGLLPHLAKDAIKALRAQAAPPIPSEPVLSRADKAVLETRALREQLLARRAARENVIDMPMNALPPGEIA